MEPGGAPSTAFMVTEKMLGLRFDLAELRT